MKRKPKTVTWDVERDNLGLYGVNGAWMIKEKWKALRLPSLRPGQRARLKVTVEVV